MGANNKQIDGNHYKKFGDLQVWDVWWAFKMNPFTANVLKYIIREKGDLKTRLKDLDKAIHYLEKYKELLIAEAEQLNQQANKNTEQATVGLTAQPVWEGPLITKDNNNDKVST